MLERAYKKFAAKSPIPDIEFEDGKRKTFLLDGPRYSAIPKNSKLYDTLQYSGLVMTILTDKKGYFDYFNDNNHDPIEVYNVIVGKTSFIELNHINNSEHSRRISLLIFFTIVYVISLIFYFYYKKK